MGEPLPANRVFRCHLEAVRVCSGVRETVLLRILDISGHTSSLELRATIVERDRVGVMMCSGMRLG